MQNLFSIAGKTALVTGGSRGIGLMIARGFVEAGAKVYISSRKAEVCDRVAAELSRHGACVSLPADVGTEAGARKLAETVAAREPALHILVNNAGANWGAPLAEFPDSAWDKVLPLNVKALFPRTRACLPLLERAARPGDPARVINIGSIDGLHVPVLETYAYSASKAAVHHLTRVLAHRLAAQNITVNAIAPGPFESKMMHETLERFRDAIVASCPLGRIGEPEDMAGAALYLPPPAGADLTRALIPVGGGITTRHAGWRRPWRARGGSPSRSASPSERSAPSSPPSSAYCSASSRSRSGRVPRGCSSSRGCTSRARHTSSRRSRSTR